MRYGTPFSSPENSRGPATTGLLALVCNGSTRAIARREVMDAIAINRRFMDPIPPMSELTGQLPPASRDTRTKFLKQLRGSKIVSNGSERRLPRKGKRGKRGRGEEGKRGRNHRSYIICHFSFVI